MLIALPQRKLIVECFAVSLRHIGDHYVMRVQTNDHSTIELPGLFTEEEADTLFWGTFQSLKEQDGFVSINTALLREALEKVGE